MADATSLWRPLRASTFRNLLMANVVTDIGAFMQSVGAAWLMLSFGAGPFYVALIQTASSAPFFLFALPAGSIGDIVDRRKLILFTETWMMGAAAVLTVLTFLGLMSPWLLLILTFAISAGDAFEAPSWRAILSELVSKQDLANASALGGIEFNVARAVGPALAGGLIAAAGVGAAFALNTLSFVGVILVIALWQRPERKRVAPVEHVGGATVAALRYVRYSPAIRRVAIRAGIVMFFASAIVALLPSIAHRASDSPLGFGFLLGCFGAGAIVGALLLQSVCSRWSAESVASGAVVVLGLAIAAAAELQGLVPLGALMVAAGGVWIIFIALLSALVQNLAPDWVRARVLAIYLLAFQGGLAAGSAVWGIVGDRWGIDFALACAGAGAVATTALASVWKLPEAPVDLSPWDHWPMPVLVKNPRLDLEDGPVLITVEYTVEAERAAEFVDAMHDYERVRRRDGASRWGIYRDTENAERYIETFIVQSWAEHLRQHARQTAADRELEKRVRSYARVEPKVRHLIYARPEA
ncbi:MAG TPA: MFS transporter [Candidatus Binatia bacterium]|jgi:MFS family permease